MRRRNFHYLWAFLFFTLLAVLWTWPLVTKMSTSVVGTIGDNIYFVWLIGWFRKALFELHVSPVLVPFLNYPQGFNLAYTEISQAQIALALPASLVAGPIFGYNFAMLACFVLSALAMYIWVRHLTGSTGAALVAGMLYGFLPYRVAHFLIGHLNLSGTMWLPLYFMGLYDLLRAPKGSRFPWKPALLAVVSLGLLAFTSQYYTYMALLFSAVFVLVYFLLSRPRRAWIAATWKGLAGFGLAALPVLAVSALPYLQLSSQGQMPNRSVSYVRMYSASPTDFILPSTDHFLWGRFIGTHFDRSMWIEATLYIGVIAFLLALLAYLRRKTSPHRLLIGGLLAIAACGFVLALGTDLHWLNQPVTVKVPGFLQALVRRQEAPIPLPGYLMFLYFPFFAKMRAMMRFGLFVLLPVCVLAGLGAAGLLANRTRGKAALITALLLALVFVDFYPGPFPQFSTVQARPVDAWLAQQPGQGAVAQFPFRLAADQDQTYYTLTHGKPYIGGFFNAFIPEQYARIQPVLDHFPSPESVSLLRQLGVQYVLVETSQYPNLGEVEGELQRQGLTRLTQQGDEVVYELR